MVSFFLYHRKDRDALIYKSVHLSYDIKTLREDAHSRDKKMSLKRPRSAREFRKRNSFLYHVCPAKLDHTCRCKSGHGNRQ